MLEVEKLLDVVLWVAGLDGSKTLWIQVAHGRKLARTKHIRRCDDGRLSIREWAKSWSGERVAWITGHEDDSSVRADWMTLFELLDETLLLLPS